MKSISNSALLASGLVLAALALVACGPAKPTSAGSATSGSQTQRADPDCKVAPGTLVNQLLGTSVGDPAENDNGTVVVCQYMPTKGIGSVLLRIQVDVDNAGFQNTRDGYLTAKMTTKDYPGFADAAYTNVLSAAGITTNTLVAHKGSVELLLASPASFAAEQALEQKVFDALT